MHKEEVSKEIRYNRFKVFSKDAITMIRTERKMTLGEVLKMFNNATAVIGVRNN